MFPSLSRPVRRKFVQSLNAKRQRIQLIAALWYRSIVWPKEDLHENSATIHLRACSRCGARGRGDDIMLKFGNFRSCLRATAALSFALAAGHVSPALAAAPYKVLYTFQGTT